MSETTAWGKVTLKIGENSTDSTTMPSNLTNLGIVSEESFAVETEEGEKLQLFGSGHVLVDEKQLENIETLSCEVIVPSLEQITKFWDVTKDESSGTYTVHSTVSNAYYAIDFEPENVGAIKLQVPKTNPSCQLTFEEQRGWVLRLSFTIVPIQVKDGKPIKFFLSKKVAAAAS